MICQICTSLANRVFQWIEVQLLLFPHRCIRGLCNWLVTKAMVWNIFLMFIYFWAICSSFPAAITLVDLPGAASCLVSLTCYLSHFICSVCIYCYYTYNHWVSWCSLTLLLDSMDIPLKNFQMKPIGKDVLRSRRRTRDWSFPVLFFLLYVSRIFGFLVITSKIKCINQ